MGTERERKEGLGYGAVLLYTARSGGGGMMMAAVAR